MDTPQLTAELLQQAAVGADVPYFDAVLGPAEDGGWWVLALRDADQPRRALARGADVDTRRRTPTPVPRWSRLGTRRGGSPPVSETSTAVPDAEAVALLAPNTQFAAHLGGCRWGTDGFAAMTRDC